MTSRHTADPSGPILCHLAGGGGPEEDSWVQGTALSKVEAGHDRVEVVKGNLIFFA